MISFNVRGLRDTCKRSKIYNWMNQKKIDIAFLQETHSAKSSEKIWRSQWRGNIYSSHGLTNSCGVSIYFRKNLPVEIHNVIRDTEGRSIAIKCKLQDELFILVNLYAPNKDDPAFFNQVFEILNSVPDMNYLIAGDYNTILKENDIRGGKDNSHKKSTIAINNLIDKHQLVDIWRIRNPDLFTYTWARRNPPIYERIDYWLISDRIQQAISKVDILPSFIADHSIPLIVYELNADKRGPGYWKMNTSYLTDEDYKDNIKKIIAETCEQYNSDSIMRWEMIKLNVRGESLRYSANKAKARKNKLNALEKKLAYHMDFDTPDFLLDDNHDQIKTIQKDIDDLLTYQTKGDMLRAKCTWLESGEKTTKYFLNLERNKAKSRVIRALKDTDGDIIDNPNSINKEIEKYYRKLFTKKHKEQNPEYLSDIETPKVLQIEQNQLNAPISKTEMYIAAKQLKKDKCPGNDGFPIEWYTTFWPQLATPLHAAYVQNTTKGHMHGTASQSIISLMNKPNRDLQQIKNWRPLSLLNCDYKIYAKVIANRLQCVLPSLISEDQTGFMKNRDISQNIIILNTIIEHCNKEKIPAMLTAYDFRQAFDTCDWTAIESILYAFGFQYPFINMIFTCFREFETRILNNGYTTAAIKITRGNKQGCPLSALIFNLVVEIISLKLKQNKNIQGITVNEVTKIVLQFADDLTTATIYDRVSFETQIQVFDEFEKFTGLAVNYDKTEIMRIGSLTNSNAKLYSTLPIKWSDGPIKVLGIWIGNDIKNATEYNYQLALQSAEKICNVWSNRILTLYGKLQVVNVLIFSQFIYKIRCLPSPSIQCCKKYRSLITKYFWSNGVAKIKYDTLIQEKEKGGIKLADLMYRDKAIKAGILYNICYDERRMELRKIAQSQLKCPLDLILDIYSTSKIMNNVNNNCSLFFKSICNAWVDISSVKPCNGSELQRHVVWFNRDIKCQGKVIFNEELYRRNINRVGQFYNNEEKRWYSFEEFENKYGNIPNFTFLHYASILKAIPKEWKHVMKNRCNEIRDSLVEKVKKGKPGKIIYQYILEKIHVPTKNVLKWEKLLNRDFSNQLWEQIIMYIYKVTNCTKLRWFQFRQINLVITTNVRRARWYPNISSNCYYCQKAEETIQHLFVDCEVIRKKIWLPLKRWLYHHCFINFDIEPYDILLLRYRDSAKDLVNNIILIAKYYIYSTKCMGKQLNFAKLMYEVSYYRRIEEIIAIKNDKKDIHVNKWSLYDRI